VPFNVSKNSDLGDVIQIQANNGHVNEAPSVAQREDTADEYCIVWNRIDSANNYRVNYKSLIPPDRINMVWLRGLIQLIINRLFLGEDC